MGEKAPYSEALTEFKSDDPELYEWSHTDGGSLRLNLHLEEIVSMKNFKNSFNQKFHNSADVTKPPSAGLFTRK